VSAATLRAYPAAITVPGRSTELRPTRVLVVDDEQPIRDLVLTYLSREQMDVLAAADGVHALELVRSERPDVVVLDVMLPGLDGLEVCRRLRSFSDAYVLMLTARRGGRSGGGAIHRCRRLPDQAVLSARAGGARPRAAPQAAGHGDGWPAAAGSRRRHRPVSRPTR